MPAPATGKDRFAILNDTPKRRSGSAADELDPLRERVGESLQKLFGGFVGQVAGVVEQLCRAANVGLRLLHGRDVQEYECLPQVVVGAEGGDGAGRDADHGAGLSVEYMVVLR